MLAVIGGIWLLQGDDTTVQAGDIPLLVSAVDLAALQAYAQPIIIDFGADECIPCKEMAPVLQTLNAEMQGKAVVQFVDVWKTPEAAQGYPVTVIPTQIFYNADGTPYMPSSDLGIEFLMYTEGEGGPHVFTAHQGGLTEAQMRLILQDMGVS